MSEEHPSLRPLPGPDTVPHLVARVFEESPPAGRGQLLEPLLKPLGLLSLAAIANGIFAKIILANGWSRLQVSAEDASQVGARDVMELVRHVQQVSAHALDSLATVISASPVWSGSAAAAMLLAVLAKQAQSRSPVVTNDFDPL
ncbi:hypothetical protein [Rhodoferax lacus]|uniref:hypothetical protein n=1 Tax=Rhodoferax lacus TaxID=2184758 RepID=UPI0011C1B6F0|nr:hypothetical protein [Rhodoferax lacus]